MGESTEELEPLFDYRRVQPYDVVCLDDDLSDSSPAFSPKRRKLTDTLVVDEVENNKKVVQVIDCEETEDDDWMPPPPKVSNDARKFVEDPTIKEMRLKKQELESFAKSAEEVIRSVEQSVKRDFSTSMLANREGVADQRTKVHCERAKIVISMQDKEGLKQFRVYKVDLLIQKGKDDKFERLFMMYAEKNKLDFKGIVFRFDGDKICPTATPDGLGMEDEDIIEVHIKSG